MERIKKNRISKIQPPFSDEEIAEMARILEQKDDEAYRDCMLYYYEHETNPAFRNETDEQL